MQHIYFGMSDHLSEAVPRILLSAGLERSMVNWKPKRGETPGLDVVRPMALPSSRLDATSPYP
jgi:hypothetical protein